MRDAEKPASLGFGKRLEGVAASVVFAEMHGSKSRGLYPLNELSGSTHIVGTDAAVHGKHGDVYGRCSLLYVFYFGQEIAISFSHVLWGRFITPVPVIQVAGMENTSVLQVYQKGNARIG